MYFRDRLGVVQLVVRVDPPGYSKLAPGILLFNHDYIQTTAENYNRIVATLKDQSGHSIIFMEDAQASDMKIIG